MRSELIFGSTKYVSNRYLLMRAAAKAIRKFHRPNTRIADTANEVFKWFGRADPLRDRSESRNSAVADVRRAA
jgi:hypothetical protein